MENDTLLQVKTCTKCCISKLIDDFPKRCEGKDNRRNQCRICWNKAMREKRAACPETHRGYARSYYSKNRLRISQEKLLFWTENKEQLSASRKKSRAANPERYREYTRKCSLKNPLLARVRAKRRKAIKRGNPGVHYTAKEFQSLCDFYDGLCLCCHQPKSLAADHIVPVSKGGSNGIENIQPLCRECNSSKWTQTIDFRWKGYPHD